MSERSCFLDPENVHFRDQHAWRIVLPQPLVVELAESHQIAWADLRLQQYAFPGPLTRSDRQHAAAVPALLLTVVYTVSWHTEYKTCGCWRRLDQLDQDAI